jgi:hypothetical protein
VPRRGRTICRAVSLQQATRALPANALAIGKITSAEVDEEEQNLDRLRRWFREIRARDPIGAPSAATVLLAKAIR